MTLPMHLALPLLLLANPPTLADDPPSLTLTTDTAAYCTQLVHKVEARHSPLPDVQRLLLEGREMCDHGEIRAGIRRLRRALVMMHHKVVQQDGQ